MKTGVHFSVLLGLFFSLALASCSTQATAQQSKRNPAAEEDSSEKIVWHDGNSERTVWIRRDLLADFSKNTPKSETNVTQLATATLVPTNSPAVRIWKIENNDSLNLSRNLTESGGVFSPVFQEGPGKQGRLRALPGNIVVILHESWSDQKVRDWARENRLTVLRKLPVGVNFYVLQSPPGLASLHLANRVRGLEGVVLSQPNWWLQSGAR